ncbi:hypothetical protein D3C84_1092640 [compost metagenome]
MARCEDHVRSQGVHADIVLGQFQRHGAGEADHPCFAGRINGKARRCPKALAAGNVDNGAAAAEADHGLGRCLSRR